LVGSTQIVLLFLAVVFNFFDETFFPPRSGETHTPTGDSAVIRNAEIETQTELNKLKTHNNNLNLCHSPMLCQKVSHGSQGDV